MFVGDTYVLFSIEFCVKVLNCVDLRYTIGRRRKALFYVNCRERFGCICV